MPKVISGKKENGEDCLITLDGKLLKQLEGVKDKVIKHNWDYVGIVCGIPGSGKSTFARTLARYFCPWFDKSYIAWKDRGDETGFIEITTKCKPYSAVILDESFQSMNTRVTMSPDFLRIINHLMIVRQKHLFIILCLPNFFDLSKGIAIFRASHLFVTYADEVGRRGRFLAFGRNQKTRLYVKGGKYLNYNAVRANFYGKFQKNQDIMPEEEYNALKDKHLQEQQKKIDKKAGGDDQYKLNMEVWKLRYKYKWDILKIMDYKSLSRATCYRILKKCPENVLMSLKRSQSQVSNRV